jgi:hypothetical protein
MATIIHTLAMLSGDSTVPADLLSENAELVKMVSDGKSYKELLEFINENW